MDKQAPAAIRGQAQGFFVLIPQGLGMLLGAQAAAKIVAHYTTNAPQPPTPPTSSTGR